MRLQSSSDGTQCPSLRVTRSQGQHNKHRLQGRPGKLGEGGAAALGLRLLPGGGQHPQVLTGEGTFWGGQERGGGDVNSGTLHLGILKDSPRGSHWNELLHLECLILTEHLVTFFW